MTSHPAAEAISALLSVFRTRWSHEALFRLLKSDLFPISRHDVDDLENYCLAYGIQGLSLAEVERRGIMAAAMKVRPSLEEREEAQRATDPGYLPKLVRDILDGRPWGGSPRRT